MPVNEAIDIAIISKNKNDGKIMLSAITEEIIRKTNCIQNYELNVSIRDVGKELLFDSEELTESTIASAKADSYSLHNSLDSTENIEAAMSVSCQCNTKGSNEIYYCGRINLHCEDENFKSDKTDALLFIIRKGDKFPEELFSQNIPVFALLYAENNPAGNQAESRLSEYVDNIICNKITSAEHFSFFYNPYGFSPDGSVNKKEDAKPYGIDEMFWKLVNIAALHGQKYYQNIIEKCSETISLRRSVFQRKSIRRVLELENARKTYLETVSLMYGIDQLIAVTEGKPLLKK